LPLLEPADLEVQRGRPRVLEPVAEEDRSRALEDGQRGRVGQRRRGDLDGGMPCRQGGRGDQEGGDHPVARAAAAGYRSVSSAWKYARNASTSSGLKWVPFPRSMKASASAMGMGSW